MKYNPNAKLTLTTPEGDKDVTRYNSALYTFLADNAMYDHVFFQDEGSNEDTFGTYVFRFNPAFARIKTFMVKEHFPAHRNSVEVAQCDMDAYDSAVDRMIEPFDAIPPDWLLTD